jgi:flap endonuclease-1
MLCGTDFNDGVSGIGPTTAVAEIREHGDLFAVLEARDQTIPNAEQVRQFFLDPPVLEEYAIDLDIDPDVAAARAYVTEEWGIPAEEVERGFERIEESLVQTGLDEWT